MNVFRLTISKQKQVWDVIDAYPTPGGNIPAFLLKEMVDYTSNGYICTLEQRKYA
jgi:hypothetical protein